MTMAIIKLYIIRPVNVGKAYRKSSIKPPGGLFNFGPSRGGLIERGAY